MPTSFDINSGRPATLKGFAQGKAAWHAGLALLELLSEIDSVDPACEHAVPLVERVVPLGKRALRLRATYVGGGRFGSGTLMVMATATPHSAAMVRSASRNDRSSYGLTKREMVVAQLLARRLTNAQVAKECGISTHTARRHTESVLRKLGVSSRQMVADVILL